jgi:hypothetical protein
MAMKRFANWCSVYVGTTVLPTTLLRALARLAGVHLFIDTEDIIYVNSKLLVLATTDAKGPRTLFFPRKTNVYDLGSSGKCLAKAVDKLTVDPGPLHTMFLWLDRDAPAFTGQATRA